MQPSRQPGCFAAQEELAVLGFRIAPSGPHTGKTLMLSELTSLFEAVEPSASSAHYRQAIVEGNVLGKPTASSRKETATRLKALYGLSPALPLFRVLRRLWAWDSDASPLLALLSGLARDPLLRASADQVIPMRPGMTLMRADMVAAIERFTRDRLGSKMLDAVARNTASSWTQSGHLTGKVCKKRISVEPCSAALSLSLWLGYAEGRRGKGLLSSFWTSVLDLPTSALIEEILHAKRLGLIEASYGAGVLSINPSGLDPEAGR